jgi:hypothetical protein
MEKPDKTIYDLKSAFRGAEKFGRVSTAEFIAFCNVGIETRKRNRDESARIAEMIVSMDSMVQTDGPRRNSVRGVSNLAALLESPDPHVDVSDLLSVWQVTASSRTRDG